MSSTNQEANKVQNQKKAFLSGDSKSEIITSNEENVNEKKSIVSFHEDSCDHQHILQILIIHS